ncbi:hypothetical protein EIJ81_01090 (plasmid) [Aliivibrio salmonicida]|uniref:hypothetical protein n=1 Tax=Aliivibrio salmonicida TaxID=40269 RepID=UPI000F70FC91|nr:hypothetical protein [Aliivibrio salmonicida]AZL83495.1 hypothetical protein EIJ81_01090 [Aliivibrio salmonicida]
MSILNKISICHECILLSEFVDLISNHDVNKPQSLHDAMYLDLALCTSQNQSPILSFGYKNELDEVRAQKGLEPFNPPNQSFKLKMFTRMYDCTIIHASTPVNVIFGGLLALSLGIDENRLDKVFVKYNVSTESFLLGTKNSINRLERYHDLSKKKKAWFRHLYPEKGLMNKLYLLPVNLLLVVVLFLASVGGIELIHNSKALLREVSMIETSPEPFTSVLPGDNDV